MYASGVTDYLNRQDVRDALNVKTSQVWELCTDRIAYTRDFNKASEWTYPILKENNIRVLHYTGNTDGSVPAEGTRAWISHMGWDVTTTFRPYYVRNKQVGGFVEVYDGVTYVTVQGVGHMAPQWKPDANFHVFKQWLKDEPIHNDGDDKFNLASQ